MDERILEFQVYLTKRFAENPLSRFLNSTVAVRINDHGLMTKDGLLNLTLRDSKIILTLNEQNASVVFVFDYLSSLGFAPIHEEMQGRNLRIKNFYHKLWFNEELTRLADIRRRS